MGDIVDGRDEIFVRIDDRMVAAVRLGNLRFRLAAHGADDDRTQGFRPLTSDEADPARRRMEQDGVAVHHLEYLADKVLRG